MYRIYSGDTISRQGMTLFDENYCFVEQKEEADAIFVRSTSLQEVEFSNELQAIARVGVGVNNIPLEKCAKQGIVVFNTPSGNANAVKELVMAGLLVASRDFIKGSNWVRANGERETLTDDVEKIKKQFAGRELYGKKIGVIGLGAIGSLVANLCERMGMEVWGYDPYVSVDGAWKLSPKICHIVQLEEIYRQCDYITIHVPLKEGTKGMIDERAISQMKQGVCLLNFARAQLVVERAMKNALQSGKIRRYVTDFPTSSLAKEEHTIAFPHLGASTREAEENCAKMAVKQVRDYLENGNIQNSVNYPACNMERCQGTARIAILHQNIPSLLRQLLAILAEEPITIVNMMNQSKQQWAYTIVDTDTELSQKGIEKLKQTKGVVKVRILHEKT